MSSTSRAPGAMPPIPSNTRLAGWGIAAVCIFFAVFHISHMDTVSPIVPACPKREAESATAQPKGQRLEGELAANPFAGQYEFYMIDSRFTKLRDPKWLLEMEITAWPSWVLNAMKNHVYCKKHGYKLTLWATPDVAISGFINRGWGNVLVAQYIKTQLDLGAWPDRSWLVYMDSDGYIRQSNTRVEDFLASETFLTPLEVEPADVSTNLRDSGNVAKILKKARKLTSSAVVEEAALLVAPEVPIPGCLGAIAVYSWLNSGVLFLNMRHNMTTHLLTRWSRSVLDLCGEGYRTERLADQHCLNDMFVGKNDKLGYMKYLGIPKDPVSFNTPAGNFIRHTWGDQGGFTFGIFGFDLITQGYRSRDQFAVLLLDMVNSGALRQLPMVVGDNSPAYTPKGEDWDTQTEDMMKKAAALLRTTWDLEHSRSVVSGIPVDVAAKSSSECIVVSHHEHNCVAVTWKVSESMRGNCLCYGNVLDSKLANEPFAMTWTRKTSSDKQE